MQSLMFLADISKQALAKDVTTENLGDFIRASAAFTPEIGKRINFKMLALKDGKVHVGYLGQKGSRVLYFSRKSDLSDEKLRSLTGGVVIADMVIEIDMPPMGADFSAEDAGRSPPGDTSGTKGDVTGSSKGDAAIHEGVKKYSSILPSVFRRLIGGWKLVGRPGVNDVIRAFWKDGVPQKGCEVCQDMPQVLSALYSMTRSEAVGRSILENDYKVYIYDTGTDDFAGGVSTHFGIRTGSIHITRREYERLKHMGIEYLAARIAHEVSELDSWRRMADELVKEGLIAGRGEAPLKYDDNWADGIRKWIRDNCNETGSGQAQMIDREYHRKGLEQEVSVLSQVVLSRALETRHVEKGVAAVKDMVRAIDTGVYKDIISDPYAVIKEPSGIYAPIFEALHKGLKQLANESDRRFFLDVVYMRASLEHVKRMDGGLDVFFRMHADHSERSAEIHRRMHILKRFLDERETMDSVTRQDVENWLAEIKEMIKYFPPRAGEIIDPLSAEIKGLLSRRSRNTHWETSYSRDPKDLVGAAAQAGGREMSGRLSGSLVRFKVLGIMKSPEIAAAILQQQESVTQPMSDANSVLNILDVYRNWSYRDLISRCTSGKKPDTGKGDSKKSDSKKGDSVATAGTKFEYISRFPDDTELKQRIDAARRSARFLFVNPQVTAMTKGSRKFRIFYGSSSGYFEVMDNKRTDYPHVIDITLMVDGSLGPKLQTVNLTSAEVPEIAGEFPGAKRINITVVGTEDIAKAFRGDSSAPAAVRADFQRLFIKVYREDIQVAGANIVTRSDDFDEKIGEFERAYIKEMVTRLNEIAGERSKLDEGLERIKLLELTQEQLDNLEGLRRDIKIKQTLIDGLEAELAGITAKTAELDKERARLLAEREQLMKISSALKAATGRSREWTPEDLQAYEDARTQYEENRQKYDADLQKYNDEIKVVALEQGQRSGELKSLKKARDEFAASLEAWEKRERDAKKQKEYHKFMQENLERHYELLCKRIEDAQFGHPLTAGVVVNGRYRILNSIGKGGFGQVYRAEDLQLKQECAIKIMSPKLLVSTSQREQALLWFEREIEILKKLREDNAPVPSVHGRGYYAGTPYFTMTLAKGLTLHEIIEGLKTGSLIMGLRERVILMHAVLKAISRFHAAKVIHRDLKPENIIVPINPDGSVAIPNIADMEQLLTSNKYDSFIHKIMIIDLGTAIPGESGDITQTGNFKAMQERTRITGTNIILGTPHYLAPEQIMPSDENPISAKTDMYAMGVTMYRIFGYRLPIAPDARDWQSITLQQATMAPTWLSDTISELNAAIEQERKADRRVDKIQLDAIRHGILEILVNEAPEKAPIIVATGEEKAESGTQYEWVSEALEENELRKRLSAIESLTDDEKDAIVSAVIRDIPQVDGFVEAIVHQMMRKDQKERPLAEQAVLEIEKYLTDKRDELLYRPRGEVRKTEGRIVRLARWFSHHVAIFIFVGLIGAASAAGFFYYMYKTAVDQREAALRDSSTAVTRMKEAEVAVQGSLEKMRKLNEERAAIQASIATLKSETGSVAQEKATLSQQVEELKKQAERSAELEKTLKEMEARIKELAAQEAILKEREKKLKDEIAASEAKFAEMRKKLEEAQAELTKFKNSLPGIFEEAKEKARALDPEAALSVLKTKYPWWTIDAADLAKSEMGLNEIYAILLDNGYFDAARNLDIERKNWIKSVLEWKQGDKERLAFVEESVKMDIAVVEALRLKGDYEAAEKAAASLLEDETYKSVKRRLEQARTALIETLLWDIASEKTAARKSEKVYRTETLIKLIEQEEKRSLYYGNLYLASGEAKKAISYFELYTAYWAKQAQEAGIDAEEKARRMSNVAQGLIMSAVAYEAQAAASRTAGDETGSKGALASVKVFLERLVKEFAEDKEIQAWVLFMEAELAAYGETGAAPEAKASKTLYEAAEKLAIATKQQVLLLLICEKLGKAPELKDMTGTWSLLTRARVHVLLTRLHEIRRVLNDAAEKYRKAYLEAKRALEEKKRKEEEEKRLEEEKKRAERRAEELKTEAVEGVKDLAGAKLRRDQIDKEIEDIKAKLAGELEAAERTKLEGRLDEAGKKKAIVEGLLKKFEEEEKKKEEENKKEEEKKSGEKKDEGAQEEGKNASNDMPDLGTLGSLQSPIASNVADAPDHRLLNAVIKRAIDEFLFYREESENLTIYVLGTTLCKNFADLYGVLSGKDEVLRLFQKDCERDGVPPAASAKLFEEGIKKLEKIVGHAGVGESKIFVIREASSAEVIINHEITEMRLHQRKAAGFLGYDRWRDVPQEERAKAIFLLRTRPDYNDFALWAHRAAESVFPVGEEKEIIPDEAADGRVLDITTGYFERPLTAEENLPQELPPLFKTDEFIAAVEGVSAGIGAEMEGPHTAAVQAGTAHAEGKGVVIFADDVLGSSAVFDLGKVAALVGKEEKLLSKIVLYAENPGKAEAVEAIIKKSNPEAEIVTVTKAEIREHCGEDFFKASIIETVLRYTLSSKTNIFNRSEQVLGVIRGPLAKSEDAAAIREELRRSSIKVPVVAFQDDNAGNIYSIVQALAKLVEMRDAAGRGTEGLLFILPPITRMSEAFQKQYDMYRLMVRSLDSAA